MRILSTSMRGDQLVKRSATSKGTHCQFCGSEGRFEYGYNGNDNRPIYWTPYAYCSLSCFDAYNGTYKGWKE